MTADDTSRVYRNRIVWGPFIPISEVEITQVEAALGTRLPQAYKNLMMAVHGGLLDYSIDIPPGDGGRPICFSRWNTLTTGDAGEPSWGSVLGQRHHLRAWLDTVGMPDALPIADDGGGSMLLLRSSPERQGEVWAFVHGLPGWAGGSEVDSFGPLAGDVDAYLDALSIDDDLGMLAWTDRTDLAEAEIMAWLDSGCANWRQRPWAASSPPRST